MGRFCFLIVAFIAVAASDMSSSHLHLMKFKADGSYAINCNPEIESGDVNKLLRQIQDLTPDEKKLIVTARSAVAREWRYLMRDAEIIIRFDDRLLEIRLQSGERTNRLLVQYDRYDEQEVIWERAGWTMTTRDASTDIIKTVVTVVKTATKVVFDRGNNVPLLN